MPKRIALKDKVMVDTTDLSNFARSVAYSSEHAQVDVSGFSATGVNEFLAGPTTQTVTFEFYGAYGATEVHQTLYPIHSTRDIVAFAWRPDQTTTVSATNPSLEGKCSVHLRARGDPRRRRHVPGDLRVGGRGRARVRHHRHLMADNVKIEVRGYKELIRASALADKATKREMRATFRKVGDPVKQEAAGLFAFMTPTPGRVQDTGLGSAGRGRAVLGKRPGSIRVRVLQMRRALVPALDANEQKRNGARGGAGPDRDRFNAGACSGRRITITGLIPYDGRYPLDLHDSPLTTREWGWIKRHAGYLPLALTADAFTDPEVIAVLAAVACRRAGTIDHTGVPDLLDRLADAPFGSTVTLELEPDEDDAAPEIRNDSRRGSSGESSPTGSERSDDTRVDWQPGLGYFGVRPGDIGELTPMQMLECAVLFEQLATRGF
jgi:hypothetical protein